MKMQSAEEARNRAPGAPELGELGNASAFEAEKPGLRATKNEL